MAGTIIDLRSDTVTKPTPSMRQAMAQAEVGDDMMGEDPTVAALEHRTAVLLGKEAALFVPSGTMANQIALGVHAMPGEEVLCDPTSHIVLWEGGGIARLSGVSTQTVKPANGLLTLDDLKDKIRPDDCHYSKTRVVSLENTQNRAGGRVHPFEEVARISRWARAEGLAMHLDGARLMNAVVASKVSADRWGDLFDSVSICFSKGLGAPVGSALAGSSAFIRKAHRLRKVFGGAMRQSGILAAGALHGLDHHVERLAEDHENAQIIARGVAETPGLSIESGTVETNLVWIVVDPQLGTARDIAGQLKEAGILVSALGPQVLRICTHLDVSRDDAERTAAQIRKLGKDRA